MLRIIAQKIRGQPICAVPGGVEFLFNTGTSQFVDQHNSYQSLDRALHKAA